jgi:hypothetical protein
MEEETLTDRKVQRNYGHAAGAPDYNIRTEEGTNGNATWHEVTFVITGGLREMVQDAKKFGINAQTYRHEHSRPEASRNTLAFVFPEDLAPTYVSPPPLERRMCGDTVRTMSQQRTSVYCFSNAGTGSIRADFVLTSIYEQSLREVSLVLLSSLLGIACTLLYEGASDRLRHRSGSA